MSLRIGLLLAGLALVGGSASAQTATSAFTFSAANYLSDAGARGIVSNDFDNDGSPDFATANAGSNTVDVFLNREFSGGGFAMKRYAVGAGPFDITSADFDYDGYPDLIVAAADADEIDVLRGGPGGVFKAPMRIAAPGNPRGVAIGWIGFGGYSIVYSSYANGTITILNYDWNAQTFTTGPTLKAGTNPQGVVIGYLKYNGGYPDVAVANTGGSGITLFASDGNGTTFTRTELGGITNTNVLVASDLNHDGHTDLAAVSTAQNTLALFFSGPGGFGLAAKITSTLSSPRGLTAVDLNWDGRPELVVANRASNSVTVFVASAAPAVYLSHQVVSAAAGSRAVAAADFDGDGRIDLTTANDYASAGTVLWNRTPGSGGTGAAAFDLRALPEIDESWWTAGAPYAAADFNENGTVDIVVGRGIVLDTKTAVAVDVGRTSPYVTGALTGDFNEDGHDDIAQATFYTSNPTTFQTAFALDLLVGDGSGKFTLKSSVAMTGLRGMAAGDFNRDGHLDVLAIDDSSSGINRRLLLGAGNGTFTETTQPAGQYDYLIGAADLNGDGNLDLIIWNNVFQQINAYLGDGRGSFPTQKAAQNVGSIYSLRIGDLNGDTIPDLAAVRWNGGLVTWLGRRDGSFSAPLFSDLPTFAYSIVLADFTGDGRTDVLSGDGILAVGKGDGTFASNRKINLHFNAALVADIDHDGLKDLLIGTDYYTAMALFNRSAEPANAAPVASVWPRSLSVPFVAQFDEEGLTIEATKSYDPNLDPLSYTWFENGKAIANGWTLYVNMPPGAHTVTLVVRDNAGAETRDTATITIAPYEEIVAYASIGGTAGAWQWLEDATAAGGSALWHPNANAAKLAAPLANPTNYITVGFPADPTQEYKLWIRLKAQSNSPFNDSVFVQFDGAVDAAGTPVYRIGTTSALAVNLEECSGCGLSGWGWRDEAWGTRGAIGTVTLRFPADARFNRMWHWMKIQTREDGVMIDQIVLSAKKYKTARPGAVKNDTTMLLNTVPWD